MGETTQISASKENLKYRMSVKGMAILALVLILPSLPILWITVNLKFWQHPVTLWGVATLIFIFPYVWFMTSLEISNEGMRLYRVNTMKWNEALSAETINLFGLKHLRVTRIKGMIWWIPLYLKGHQPIEVALKEKAPAGNPIRELFT